MSVETSIEVPRGDWYRSAGEESRSRASMTEAAETGEGSEEL